MANPKLKKGRSLEKAVGFIQENILKSDPQMYGVECKVDFNKILILNGVRHEIDVLVKTAIGSNYEATWIFECKNWSKPVGKKEIADFADKVDAVGANRGYLVAQALSKYAIARLEQDKRLTFIQWTDQFQSPLDNLEAVHKTFDPLSKTLTITWQEIRPDNPTEVLWDKVQCSMNHKSTDLGFFVEQHVRMLVDENQQKNYALYLHEGSHLVELKKLFNFAKGECVINKLDVKLIELKAAFFVRISKHRVTSKFELKNQGRVFAIEIIDDDYPQDSIEIRILQRV